MNRVTSSNRIRTKQRQARGRQYFIYLGLLMAILYGIFLSHQIWTLYSHTHPRPNQADGRVDLSGVGGE